LFLSAEVVGEGALRLSAIGAHSVGEEEAHDHHQEHRVVQEVDGHPAAVHDALGH